jgi:hypothetical protein
MPSACPELARSAVAPALRRKESHSQTLQRIAEDLVIPGHPPLFASLRLPPAGHADPRTTRLYDRRDKKITRNIVERISI